MKANTMISDQTVPYSVYNYATSENKQTEEQVFKVVPVNGGNNVKDISK